MEQGPDFIWRLGYRFYFSEVKRFYIGVAAPSFVRLPLRSFAFTPPQCRCRGLLFIDGSISFDAFLKPGLRSF